MSELLAASQESKSVSDCHDPSPQYSLCQSEPSPDSLASIMENERARRILVEKYDIMDGKLAESILPLDKMHLQLPIDHFDKAIPMIEEFVLLLEESIKIIKRMGLGNPKVAMAIARLTDSEFNQAYDSSKQKSNCKMGGELAENPQHRDGSFSSPGQVLGSSKNVDDMDGKLGQRLQSYGMVGNVRKASDSTPAKPRGFWRKYWNDLTRP